jgi:Ca2+-binding RTX toxin-like protein
MATTQVYMRSGGDALGDENDNLIKGDDRDNLFYGYAGSDTLYGYTGNDTLEGGDGDDFIYGGAGDDGLGTGSGNDYVEGGLGDDVITQGRGSATIYAGEGDDSIQGSYDNTTIILNDDLENAYAIFNLLDDYSTENGYQLVSADGTDWVEFIDEIIFNNATLSGSEVTDTFGAYETASDERGQVGTIVAGSTAAQYTGNHYKDLVTGSSEADTISGASQSDTLSGGDGDDFLNGGWGFEFLEGGEGADRFFHTGHTHHGMDWVADYSADEGDVLEVASTYEVFEGVTADDFVVHYATTEGQGDDAVAEAYIGYLPTGRILWALTDGADAESILIQVGDLTFDLLA